MKRTIIGAIALSMMMLAWGAPASVVAEENPRSIDKEAMSEMPIDEFIVHQLEESGLDEMPDTAEVRVGGQGDFQEIAFEDALDMMLKHKTADTSDLAVPLQSGPDVGVASGTTPSACHPAIIHNVIDFGTLGADVTVENAGAEATNDPACNVLGAETYGGAGTVTIDVTSSTAATGAVANAAPGFAQHGEVAEGFTSATAVTPDCTLVLEFVFFFIATQQIGTGMPGCTSDNVSATSFLEF